MEEPTSAGSTWKNRLRPGGSVDGKVGGRQSAGKHGRRGSAGTAGAGGTRQGGRRLRQAKTGKQCRPPQMLSVPGRVCQCGSKA